MVEKELLVVKKNDRQQIDRICITQVYSSFVDMVGRCETDREYALTPCPWPSLASRK